MAAVFTHLFVSYYEKLNFFFVLGLNYNVLNLIVKVGESRFS